MIFDAHGDILTDMYLENKRNGTYDTFKKRHLEKYQKAEIKTSIFVNYTHPDEEDTFDEIFDYALEEIKRNQDIFKVCLNYTDIQIAKKENKIGVIIGVEGLKYLKDINHFNKIYDLGVRHITVTWNELNKYGSGLDNPDGGLTLEGINLIKIIEKKNVIIDLAHSSPKTFADILNHTKKPVIISHGNCKALCNHRRNYTDSQLLKIKERNGVIGITAVANFISSDKKKQTVWNLAKHVDYAVKLIGINHVGIGLDICYYLNNNKLSTNIIGLEDISKADNIFKALKAMGYSDEDINKIKYQNFERVVKEILG